MVERKIIRKPYMTMCDEYGSWGNIIVLYLATKSAINIKL